MPKLTTIQNHTVMHESIGRKIFVIQGQKVILDRDLAELYGVQTRVLNQAVKRNFNRFPKDFMFMLSREEIRRISQFVTSLKFSKSVYVFTEHGAIMAASVLNTQRAVEVSVYVVRAFAKLKELLATHKDLQQKLETMEKKFTARFRQVDAQVKEIFQAIAALINVPAESSKKIGFKA